MQMLKSGRETDVEEHLGILSEIVRSRRTWPGALPLETHDRS